MLEYIRELEVEFEKIIHGFTVYEKRALIDVDRFGDDALELAYEAYSSDYYQVRMYAVFLFGYLSYKGGVMDFLRKVVSQDDSWRVQEILAKSFDEHCRISGYEESIPIIDQWLNDKDANVRRAVTEGLRIWTSREFFNERPREAITRLANHKTDESEYVRKSVGNALRDISKAYPELVRAELDTWKLGNRSIAQVHKLANKSLIK